MTYSGMRLRYLSGTARKSPVEKDGLVASSAKRLPSMMSRTWLLVDELLGDQPSNASDQADSGCLSPLVSMVQSTDSRQCDDFRRRRRSVRDRSQARCVLVQPQVATVLMIVADVSSHEPDEMTCAENHDVLKELATAAADPPLRGSVLPWVRNEVRTGFVPVALMNSMTAALKIKSRSKTRYLGAVS